MELFTLDNITISRDWLTPIGVALVLLSFYWLRNRLPLILKATSFAVLAFWLTSLGYLTSECYGVSAFTEAHCIRSGLLSRLI